MQKRMRNFDGVPGCSMEAALHILGGKWKGVILYHLFTDGTLRFGELFRALRGINQRLLTRQLRELEEHGLITRKVYPVVPPHVEYSLTEEGRTLHDLIMGLSVWGRGWLERRGMRTAKDEDFDVLKHAAEKRPVLPDKS
ncbi:transcriptional regulator [Aristophania vespae]|uniref:Transcriptional regulator n=1 Tax=Aristophania vespae TaxID=2697033 RepID=A0A6P1NBM5_9PROT|nr:helix-turn-helix domain-containing protein [Aristophania vespae]QHI96075.1 transcriptional regulator [Aristophania vespae]